MTVGSAQLRFWIDMTLECVRRDHTKALVPDPGDQRGPFLTARAIGMALTALRDAHAIARGADPAHFLLSVVAPPALAGSNPGLAAAAACHEVLLLRYPKQARMLTPAWVSWREIYSPATGSSSEVAGRAFGSAVHAFGIDDAAIAAMSAYTPAAVPPYVPYAHVAPPNEPTQKFKGSAWGMAKPLFVHSVPDLPKPPHAENPSPADPLPHYAADFAKVAKTGIDQRSGSTRTLDEEIIGIFWGYDGPSEIGTPPRLYMQVVLTVLDAIEARTRSALTETQELDAIAGAAVALADAGINAWHYKYSPNHMMWRPVVGIRETPFGVTKIPGWLPLGRPDTNSLGQTLTPDFPAYPSGHATFGAAAFHFLRLYLVEKDLATFSADGTDDVYFDFVSDEFNGRNTDPRTQLPREHLTRRYPSLWKAIKDNSLSRVYLGVHWQFDGITKKGNHPDGVFGVPAAPVDLGRTGGVWLGSEIAKQVARKLGVTDSTIDASRM